MPGFCHSQATSQFHQQTLEYLILLLSGGAIGGALGGAPGGAIGGAPGGAIGGAIGGAPGGAPGGASSTLREIFLLQPHSHGLGDGRPQVEDTPSTLSREPPQSLGRECARSVL